MIPDAHARKRALDPEASFIVQAPAGSGKTELLIQRYLRLLARVDRPEAVVAITFTKKAAAEIRSRVLEALRLRTEPADEPARSTWLLARDVLARDRAAEWRLLENPTRLEIGTIDALCARITRQMPWLARFGAPPATTEKAGPLYAEAAHSTLSRIREEERAGMEGPLSILLLHLDNDFTRAAKLISTMLEKRDQWLRHTGVNADLPALRVSLESSLDELVRRKLAELERAFPEDALRELVSVGDLPPAPRDLATWVGLADLLLVKNTRAWRKKQKAAIRRSTLASLECHPGLLALLYEVRKLPPSRFEDSQWRVMEALLAILPHAVSELGLIFAQRGTVDFTELSIRASHALGDIEAPTDLALSLGYSIEHILVDEFQDTSYTHFDLLAKLTAGWTPGDGRTLFLVGDPMQSIYRFRQAEVGLFLRCREQGIGSLPLEPLTLELNFRSTPALVDWYNSAFAGMFATAVDIDKGAVPYSSSTAHRLPSRLDATPVVHPFLGDSADGEAARVMDLLASSGPGPVAILVRARTHLPSIVAALRKRRIRFQAIEIDNLGSRPLIQDLMALTFALLHLADHLSWFAILRAPWCGLRLADLQLLAPDPSYPIVWDALRARSPLLSEDAQSRVQRVLPVLEDAVRDAGRVPLRDLIERTWIRLGGPGCVESDSDLDDAAAFFDLLEGIGLSGGADDFRAVRAQVDDLFAQPDSRSTDALQVMTIHKAKGLEFDTVILPGLGHTARSEETALLTWTEQEGKLLLAPIAEAGSDGDPICKYLGRLEKQKNDNETKRLLYVAVTRARSALHLLGCANWTARAGVTAEAGSFLELLWPVIGTEFIALAATRRAPVTTTPDIFVPKPVYRVPPGWTVPPPPPAVFRSMPAIARAQSADAPEEWAGDTLRLIGTVVHAYLQQIARLGPDAWRAPARAVYASMLANRGVPPSGLDQSARIVQAALARILHDPTGRWLLTAHPEAESECEITGLLDGVVCRAVIDRTFVDDGIRWIVDYKTGPHGAGDLDTFLEAEKLRYRDQLEHYARLLSQSETRPIRLGLYFPLVAGWREWAAPTVERRQASLF